LSAPNLEKHLLFPSQPGNVANFIHPFGPVFAKHLRYKAILTHA
jgi:hypothetical protein